MCQLVPMLLISQLSAHLYAEDRPLDCSQWKTWLFFMSVLIFRWGQALFRFGSIFLENSCFQTIIFLSNNKTLNLSAPVRFFCNPNNALQCPTIQFDQPSAPLQPPFLDILIGTKLYRLVLNYHSPDRGKLQ